MEAILTAIPGLSIFALFCNLAGNSIVIAVIWKVKTMKTITNSMLFSLAVSDLQFGAVVFLETVRYYYHMKEAGGAVKMKGPGSVLLRVFASSFTLAAIAVERYYAILKPFAHRAKMTKKLIIKVISCIWISAIIFTLPEILNFYVELLFSDDNFRDIYVSVFLITSITVPGIIMTTCYSQIVYRIWFKTQERQTTNAGVLKSRKKLTKLLVTITLVFFVCWTPLLGRSFEFESPQRKTLYSIFSGLLALTGTALNPVLYSLHSVRFRQAVRKRFGIRLRYRKSRSVRDHDLPGLKHSCR